MRNVLGVSPESRRVKPGCNLRGSATWRRLAKGSVPQAKLPEVRSPTRGRTMIHQMQYAVV